MNVVAVYHVPRSQVWEGSRGRASGRVHLHIDGHPLCRQRMVPWYPREPFPGEQRCARCVVKASHEGIEWPGETGPGGASGNDGTAGVAPPDGSTERLSRPDVPGPASPGEPA
jgi:hypothetical protein